MTPFSTVMSAVLWPSSPAWASSRLGNSTPLLCPNSRMVIRMDSSVGTMLFPKGLAPLSDLVTCPLPAYQCKSQAGAGRRPDERAVPYAASATSPSSYSRLIERVFSGTAPAMRTWRSAKCSRSTRALVSRRLDLRATDVRLDAPAQVRLPGKGNKVRVCPIWATTAQLLRPLCAVRGIDGPDRPLFVNHRGEPLTRFGLRYLLRRTSRRGSTPRCAASRPIPTRFGTPPPSRWCARSLESRWNSKAPLAWLKSK